MEVLNKDAYNILSFSDYFQSKKILNEDWITVARMDPVGRDDERIVFSVLIDKTNSKEVIKSENWEIDRLDVGEYHFDFGHPYFFKNGNKIDYIQGAGMLNKILIEPFIFYIPNNGHYKSHFEILQDFILYHDLRIDGKGNYVNPESAEVIIKVNNPEYINIKTHELKDYLAARKKILVLYINYERIFNDNIHNIISIERYEGKIENKDENYKLLVTKHYVPNQSFSWLRGKEIINPYSKPLHSDYNFLVGKSERQNIEFITGINENGDEVLQKCGVYGDITPCFFRKDLLLRYQEDHENYSVNPYTISKDNFWIIPYDINEEGLVHVYMKDLGDLPIDEQTYWRSFNVAPKGRLNRGFFERQMECKYTPSNNPVDVLLSKKNEVNKKFEKRFGFKLYTKLSGEDEHISKITHDLTLYNQKQLDDQCINLSKVSLIVSTRKN